VREQAALAADLLAATMAAATAPERGIATLIQAFTGSGLYDG
jgi:hypothetical protein